MISPQGRFHIYLPSIVAVAMTFVCATYVTAPSNKRLIPRRTGNSEKNYYVNRVSIPDRICKQPVRVPPQALQLLPDEALINFQISLIGSSYMHPHG